MSGAGVAAVGFLGDDCVAEDDDAVGAVVIKSDAAFFMLPCYKAVRAVATFVALKVEC